MRFILTFVAVFAVLIAAQGGARAQATPEESDTRRAAALESDARWAAAAKPAREMMDKAYEYFKAGDLAHAEEAARQVMRMGYVGGEARVLITKICLSQRRYQDALTLCEVYLKQTTNREEGLDLILGLCLLRLGRGEEARKLYWGETVRIVVFERNAVDMTRFLPSWDSARGAEANFLFALGILHAFGSNVAITDRDKEALSYLEAAAKLAPYNGVIAFYTAHTLRMLGRRAEALPYSRRAAVSGPARLRERAVAQLPLDEQAQYKKANGPSDTSRF